VLATSWQEKLRVLVVDDHADTVGSTAIRLRMGGHEVKTASNGVEAVARTRRFQPHIALLDLAMSDMDGYEVARRIQKLVLPRPPLLVALSGYGDGAAIRQSAEAGFDLHLLKPVEPDVFERLQVLVQEFDEQVLRLAHQRQRQQQMLSALAASYIEMGHALLQVARTTTNELTRTRCITKTQRICDRLVGWISGNPNLDQLRVALRSLTNLIPR